MSSVEAHYLLNSLYNLEFGLFDHLDPVKKKTEPFAVIRAFPEEDPQADSLLEDVVTRYARNRIYDRYKLTFLDYMKLPVPTARKLDQLGETVFYPMEKEDAQRKKKALDESFTPRE